MILLKFLDKRHSLLILWHVFFDDIRHRTADFFLRIAAEKAVLLRAKCISVRFTTVNQYFFTVG
jgi:hypothetical protein